MTATNSGDRLTISEQIYIRHLEGEGPTVFTHRYNTPLSSEEQPYSRRYKIGTVWEDLSVGWITDAKYLWIENHGAGKLQRQPTLSEAEKRANRIVEISFREDPDLFVYPGESIRVSPSNLTSIQLRVRDEPTFVTVTLVQK